MTPHIEFPVIGAKWAIGFTAMFHIAVGSLAIGFAFIVTVAQIIGYVKKDRRYDLLAKRVQLIHVCVYNIGTIVAIGLVFALSGLFPQFWSQIFVHLFWTLIVEELLFFLLATTLTFHYFFWEHMWGHKKLHIALGALLNPLFFLQFLIINGMGAFMLTPGFQEAQVTMRQGILGWDRLAFYNPSFLMLTAHRTFANFAYAGFVVAAISGASLYLVKRAKVRQYHEDTGRLSYFVGFISYLALPIIGYFYALVLRYDANEAYVNLMWGKGDVVAMGIDWWWLKHLIVAGMFGMGVGYFSRLNSQDARTYGLPRTLLYAIVLFYLMFYMSMGMVMTWKFFFWTLAVGTGAAFLALHLFEYHAKSGRAVFLITGILSFLTVMLGGYSREASRPRFVDRISHYDNIYVPEERQPVLMVDKRPEDVFSPEELARAREAMTRKQEVDRLKEHTERDPVVLIRERCSGCHTLERVKNYRLKNWALIVRQMRAYGLKLTSEEAAIITKHLESGSPY